jgi:hypothetical protein
MNQAAIKKHITHISWEDTTSDEEQISNWYDSAFHAALEKLQAEHENTDTVLRMGEAFGRGLYAQRLKEKSPEWTIKEWVEKIQKDVCQPLGTEFTFTKISPDIAITFMNRNPLIKTSQERQVTSLFNFGVMRGLFPSAFPKGELLFNEAKPNDQPEFIFKAYGSAKDKFERERVIGTFTFLKKDNGA